MYDESNEWYEDIYDMSVYDIAELFEKIVKDEVGITVTFKSIDLEVSILED
ncbi:putative transcriptional regulator [Streptococcus pyogenes]|nr:putative transcriptional regulator [Streptococcus pyogenes]VGV74726.1 putative transcriptional regulator [Streptococcus pyogenes]VHB14709.1 putative transcriptional regulator [Streptococcus pyogenes]VHB21342.1 putative transcriptional regulator [Streptococcus pyogenes]